MRSSHLFLPMPDVIREDMAFFDRIHFYLPVGRSLRCGWSSSPSITALWWITWRRRYGNCGSTITPSSLTTTLFPGISPERPRREGRPQDGVWVGRLLYPHGDVSKEELAELVEMAIEGRRRVKEQLKKMGSSNTTRPRSHTSIATPEKNALLAYRNKGVEI